MELKDAILSTLAEIEDNFTEDAKTSLTPTPANAATQEAGERASTFAQGGEKEQKRPATPQDGVAPTPVARESLSFEESVISQEALADATEMDKFLLNLRERVLVLFEGLLSMQTSVVGDTAQVEKKLDLTVNFLEYLLANIEEKLDKSQE